MNQDAVVKVYHSPDYAQVKPASRLNTEEEMLHMILSTIEQNTDFYTMPPQEKSVKNFITNGSNNLTFGEALKKLEMYANAFNGGVIPNYLNCVRKAGGVEAVRSIWQKQ